MDDYHNNYLSMLMTKVGESSFETEKNESAAKKNRISKADNSMIEKMNYFSEKSSREKVRVQVSLKP